MLINQSKNYRKCSKTFGRDCNCFKNEALPKIDWKKRAEHCKERISLTKVLEVLCLYNKSPAYLFHVGLSMDVKDPTPGPSNLESTRLQIRWNCLKYANKTCSCKKETRFQCKKKIMSGIFALWDIPIAPVETKIAYISSSGCLRAWWSSVNASKTLNLLFLVTTTWRTSQNGFPSKKTQVKGSCNYCFTQLLIKSMGTIEIFQ